eukprot:4241343-Pyramimonas_sp.AAC.1
MLQRAGSSDDGPRLAAHRVSQRVATHVYVVGDVLFLAEVRDDDSKRSVASAMGIVHAVASACGFEISYKRTKTAIASAIHERRRIQASNTADVRDRDANNNDAQ